MRRYDSNLENAELGRMGQPIMLLMPSSGTPD
jgi:hypothetical protein